MPFLLAHWKTLIPLAIAAVLGLMLLFTRLELANLKAAVARATLEATEAARAQEAKNAAIAQEVEKAHAERAKAIDEAYDANRELARTRGLRFRVKPGVSCAATTPGSNPDGTAEIRLPDEIARDLLTLARDADRAAEYAMTCHSWAIQVGK